VVGRTFPICCAVRHLKMFQWMRLLSATVEMTNSAPVPVYTVINATNVVYVYLGIAYLEKHKTGLITKSGGSLGSCVDEERS